MRGSGRKWLNGFADSLGFPKDYLLLDLETSGFDFNQDLVIQWSLGVVRDGRLDDVTTQSLDWTRVPSVSLDWLSDKLSKICQKLQLDPDDESHPFSIRHLQSRGTDPFDSLKQLREFLFYSECRVLVGHNHLAFDLPMLEGNLERYLPTGLPCCPAGMDFLDTGALAVGVQLNHPIPKAKTLESACSAILVRKRQTFWKLHSDCVDLFELDGVEELVKAGHTADADIRLVHRIVEKARELGEAP